MTYMESPDIYDYLFAEISEFVTDNYYANVGIYNEIDNFNDFMMSEPDDNYENTPYYPFVWINFPVDDGMNIKIQIPFEIIFEWYSSTDSMFSFLGCVDEVIKDALLSQFRKEPKF